ncbi:NADH-dependent flavin oxidoreductase [Caballeronia arationis]|jgi:2,4-dienoyl-CoA reductase-like NADH-dependent reductase (Old Yellow Enzyme family)|uniref:NADH:flavin oxidoreductase/NADH oxidase n=1 Tax=Caballeronia arationis TaxID=1777142 RepID=UPI00074CE4E3|nr:NADH:flavin oxidoreductase/NADH oxidase [Caballeronia arationis]SAK42662.1 NADH-dependent flavin oxidoreductase [Caballeronia arationis]
MSALFSPATLRGVTLPNRILVSPMCQYSAERGEATAWHMIHLGHLALSGAAMLFIEATAVEPDGRITPGDLGLWDDATEAALKPVLAAIRKHSKIAVTMQLAHAGRKGSSHVPWEGGQLIPVSEGGWMPHAPSAIPHKDGETPPLALDTAGLIRVREAFVASAKRAARLGIDGLELHAAHGYLLHQFLSPVANQRTDEYGGSLENRMRFPLEIFDAIRAVFPDDRPIGVRVSASDWVDGGWGIEDTIAFANELKKRGVDWIDVSSGGVSPLQKIPLEPGYQVPFAKAVKEATSLPTIAVGLITDPMHAEEIIESGQADFIALARALLYNPRWPWHAAAQLGSTVEAPPQYWRSQPRDQKALFGDISFGQR